MYVSKKLAKSFEIVESRFIELVDCEWALGKDNEFTKKARHDAFTVVDAFAELFEMDSNKYLSLQCDYIIDTRTK